MMFIYRLRKCVINTRSLERSSRCRYSTVREEKTSTEKKHEQKLKYSHTVLLPKTSFPLRLNPSNRTENDLLIYNKCKFAELYEWQRKHVTGPEFILHDGPPYANGKLHMGHAVNKILKDITIRQKLLQGHRIHYVPGFDCHGLPIELKAVTETSVSNKLDSIEIRHKAQKLAKKAAEGQVEVFQSWGVMANWKECYYTLNNEYIKNELNQFLELYNKGLIYRDVKPIFWSPSSRTALAEAELEYNNQHVSKAVVLGLCLVSLPEILTSALASTCKIRALVWTTTPWSLPANQAICYNPDLLYCVATFNNSENEMYLLAVDCVHMVQKKLGQELVILHTFLGGLLKDVQYSHPFQANKHLPFLAGSHVSSEMGTGLVHTAPAHGSDDFLVSLKHQIPVVTMVDDDGCYTADAGLDLEGLFVLNEGNAQVLHILKSLILQSENYIHSYPYDWRTKEPVIIKASQQWFVGTDAIKAKAVELLHGINVYPQKLQSVNTLISQLQKRPYWCISRQRVWGVPIPALFNKTDDSPLITRELIEHYNNLIDKCGPDFWWTLPKEAIAPDHLLDAYSLSSQDVEKGKDILDIWFDSGISWSHVLGNDKQADLYLEGVDQFTGWFQSSLMTSAALRGKSPYKSIFVHGFAVDEKGHKMSKSIGNVVDPQEITQGGVDLKKHPAFGVDTLRWWVASHASQNANVPVSQSIMEASASEIHKIRTVLRFLLGSLSDYHKRESLSFDCFFSLDLWMLHKLKKFENEVLESYNHFQYNNVCKTIINFVTNEVSAIYCHMIKDRLYCSKKDDVHRYYCQVVIKHILETVSRSAAPILPFLMEEVYLYHPCKDEQHLFYSKAKMLPEEWNFPEAEYKVNTALKVKEIINKLCSKNTMELHAHVQASGNEFKNLMKLSENKELNELLQVSYSEVVEGTSELKVKVEQTSSKQCGRCRQYTSHFPDNLCHRCERVLKEMQFKVSN